MAVELRIRAETQRRGEPDFGWPMVFSTVEERELFRCSENPYLSVTVLVTFYRNLGTRLLGEIDIDAGVLSAFEGLELDVFREKVAKALLMVIGAVCWEQAAAVATIDVADSILGSSIL